MPTNKRVFTLREHRSMTNYIEYVLLKHLEDIEKEGADHIEEEKPE